MAARNKIISVIAFLIVIPLLAISLSSDKKSGKSLVELRTYEQIKQSLRLKLKPVEERKNVTSLSVEYLKSLNLPSSYDLRQLNGTTPIKDQDGCGGCWAFAPIGLFEGLIKMKTLKTVDLAEQQVIDCVPGGSCADGGWPPDALDYLVSTGVVLEKYYPLTWTDKACTVSRPSDYYLNDWKEVYVYGKSLSSRIQTVKSVVYNYGPTVVAMEVTDDFTYYNGGVYTFSGTLTDPNHSVCIIGWKDDSSITNGGYWIIRNSWGSDWAEDGYGRIGYGQVWIDGYLCAYGVYNVGNQPPQFNNIFGTVETREGTPLQYTLTATDPENDQITYSASNLPAGAIFNSSTAVFTWTPNYLQAGTYSINFYASDGKSQTSQTATLIVQNVKTIKK